MAARSELQGIENRILKDIIIKIGRDKMDFTIFEQIAKTCSGQTIACLSELYSRLLREAALPSSARRPQQDIHFSPSQPVGPITELGEIIDDGTARSSADTASVTSAPDHWISPPTSSDGEASTLNTEVTHNPWQDEESTPSLNTKAVSVPISQQPPSRESDSSVERYHQSSLSQVISNGHSRNSHSISTPSTQSGRPSSSMTSGSSPERPRPSHLAKMKSNEHAPTTQPIPISGTQSARPSPLTTSNSSFEYQRTNSLSQSNSNDITPISSSPFSYPSPPGKADSSRRSSSSFFSRLRRSSKPTPSTGSGRDYLPAESNEYLGLCKSAWRMQVGQDVSAVTTGQRPTGGLYQSIRYIVCSQSGCRFEGRAVRGSQAHDAIDRTVIRFSDQVHFRWKFLMRNHVLARSKDAVSFGCVLCSSSLIANSSGMLPIFDGERAFLEHIQEAHVGEGQWPEGHAKYRAGCVVSKGYPDDDAWDLLLLEWDGIASPPGMRARGRNDSGLEPLVELDGRDMNDRGEVFVHDVHELDGMGKMEIGDINGIGT